MFIAVFFSAVHIFDITLTGILPECALRELTGLKCPGCGGTRCMEALFHFDVFSAFYYNPYVAIVLCVLLFIYIKYTVNAFSPSFKMCKYDISIFTAVFIPVSIIVFVMIRNTQLYQTVLY